MVQYFHVTVHSVQFTDCVCNANHKLVIELGIGVICHYNFASYDTVTWVVVSHCFLKKILKNVTLMSTQNSPFCKYAENRIVHELKIPIIT